MNRLIMPKRRQNRLNLLWVAFAALLGMLSINNVARACTEVKAPKACCSGDSSGCGGCCSSSKSTAPLSNETTTRAHGVEWKAASATVGVEITRPGTSCECRSNEPVAPASKPVSSSSDESRSDQGGEEVIAYLDFAPKPLVPSLRPVSPNDGTPKCPVYLRICHLVV